MEMGSSARRAIKPSLTDKTGLQYRRDIIVEVPGTDSTLCDRLRHRPLRYGHPQRRAGSVRP